MHGNLLAADASGIGGMVFNLADGRATTLLELLRLLNELLGLLLPPQFSTPRPGDIRDSLADITLARQFLRYEPQVAFEEGLRRSLAYYQQHLNNSP